MLYPKCVEGTTEEIDQGSLLSLRIRTEQYKFPDLQSKSDLETDSSDVQKTLSSLASPI